MEKLSLNELIGRVSDRLKPIALARNITISLHTRPITLEGDERRLDQVVSNLIDNAVKYTEPGGKVSVELSQEGDEAILRVADTGVGIAKENIPYLFDRFFRVDKARVRGGQSSTGLGLSIVDQFVRLHGGYIEVSSEEGKGSVFTVHLPLVQGK
jgi:two-component system phosphate regulon sensor histidine kinase PhoR